MLCIYVSVTEFLTMALTAQSGLKDVSFMRKGSNEIEKTETNKHQRHCRIR
jgi:hypothetical protein